MDNKQMTNEEKIKLFKSIAQDPVKRAQYIQSRAAVIEPLISKQSQVRQIFDVETLAAGAQPQYFIGSQEPQVAWLAPGVGSAPRRQTEGDEVYLSTFNVYARVEWLIDLATDGRWQVAEEMTWYMAEQVKEAENILGWNLIKAAAADVTFPATHSVEITTGTGVDTGTGKGFFSKQLLSAMIYAMHTSRRTLTDVYVSPLTLFDIFNYWTNVQTGVSTTATTTTLYSADTVPETVRESIFRQGPPNNGNTDNEYTLNIFGVRIHPVYDSNIVADNAVYGFDLSHTRSRFGVMPIRDTFTTYEDPIAITEWKVGYFGKERIGFGVLDVNCLVKGTITRP